MSKWWPCFHAKALQYLKRARKVVIMLHHVASRVLLKNPQDYPTMHVSMTSKEPKHPDIQPARPRHPSLLAYIFICTHLEKDLYSYHINILQQQNQPLPIQSHTYNYNIQYTYVNTLQYNIIVSEYTHSCVYMHLFISFLLHYS